MAPALNLTPSGDAGGRSGVIPPASAPRSRARDPAPSPGCFRQTSEASNADCRRLTGRRSCQDGSVAVDGVPCVYLAGPDGFTTAGLRWHREQVIPAVRGVGLEPLSPWDGQLGEELERIAAMPPGSERQRQLEMVDFHIGAANAKLIERSRGVLALLDGPDVDSGTAAEIGYAAKSGCLIVGLRTDLRRTGDNEGVTVNLQVEYFIRASGGSVQVSLVAAVSELARLLDGRRFA